jgi:hypothetical protein
LVSWGVQQYGIRYVQTENDPIVSGYVYEEIRRYDSDIPPEKYFELLKQLRERIDGSGYGLKTLYIEVDKNWIRVQFTKTGSPLITWGTVIQIIAIAISIALAAWAASLLVHEMYKLATVVGSETVGMFLQVLTLYMLLSLFSPMIDIITRAFRRKE